LFSTNCEGQVRWSQAIGGNGSGDSAYNIALDSNNNVYVGARVGFATNPLYPVHFSPTEVLPVPTNPNTVSDGWKTSFIVKYDSNGDFVWKKAVQGDVNQNNFDSRIHDIVMDSQNKLHFIVVFAAGTHLDGLVNVPANTYQYYLVKFNTVTQQFDDVLLLPTTGQMEPQNTRFAYDETSNIYYISSIRESLMPFSYNNEPIINRSFVLAFRGFNSSVGTDGEEIWRREIYSDPNSSGAIQLNRVKSLAIDGNSDLYIGGILGWDYNLGTSVKIYDPSDTTTDYTFTPNAATLNMPFMAKFNNQGAVQWVKTPELDTNYTSNTSLSVGGIAFRGNEVAMGSSETYFKWDNLSLNRPQYYQPDATLLRFNKQTGATIAMHAIEGGANNNQSMTVVAVDNDGNYITGGNFKGGLFTNTGSNVPPVYSAGDTDFFVAKLAASVCGTAVSTEKFNNINVNVYPNPTNDIVNIETQETLHNYEVYNVLGQQIQKGMFGNNNQINLHGATTGTYFIKVTTTQGSTATVKVVKK